MNLAADREYYLRLKQELDAFKDFARDNFGIIVTGFYFVVSVAGLVYLNVLLDEFNVNVFHHIELSDYLLAALSNNNLIIVYLAFCFLMFLYNRWKTKHIPAVKKDTWYNRFYYQVFGFLYRLPALKTQLAGFFLTLLFYAYQSGLNRADSIHQGFGDSYNHTELSH